MVRQSIACLAGQRFSKGTAKTGSKSGLRLEKCRKWYRSIYQSVTNADGYNWQFDVYSTTSNETNPKRHFGKGKYSITLPIQNSVGTNKIIKLVEVDK